jgi:hypothetical protein
MAEGRHRARRGSPRRWFDQLSARGKLVVRLVVGLLTASAAVVAVLEFVSKPGYTASGTVRCASGATVVQAWVISTKGDRSVADLEPIGDTAEVVGPIARFSYYLPNGGSYVLHVGCGGIAAAWATANYSVSLHGSHVAVVCHDPKPVPGETPHGRCVVGP